MGLDRPIAHQADTPRDRRAGKVHAGAWSVTRRKARSWSAMRWGDRGLVVEAAIMLGAARLVLVFLPYRRYARWLPA